MTSFEKSRIHGCSRATRALPPLFPVHHPAEPDLGPHATAQDAQFAGNSSLARTAAEGKPLQRRRNLSMIALDLKAIWEMSDKTIFRVRPALCPGGRASPGTPPPDARHPRQDPSHKKRMRGTDGAGQKSRSLPIL